jgi:hypothetical protein
MASIGGKTLHKDGMSIHHSLKTITIGSGKGKQPQTDLVPEEE